MSNVPNLIKEIADIKIKQEKKLKEGFDESYFKRIHQQELESKIKELRKEDFKNNVAQSFSFFAWGYFGMSLFFYFMLTTGVAENYRDAHLILIFLASLGFIISLPFCFLYSFNKKASELYVRRTINIPAEASIDHVFAKSYTTNGFSEFDYFINDYLTSSKVRMDYSSLRKGRLRLVENPSISCLIDRTKKHISIYFTTIDFESESYDDKKHYCGVNADEYNSFLEYLENKYNYEYTDFLMRAVEKEIDEIKKNNTEKG